MPTIEISEKDLKQLVRKKFSLERTAEWVKGKIEREAKEKDKLKVELSDVNRPDLWSVEGIARELKRKLGLKISYQAKKPSCLVKVNFKVKRVRPLISCAVVRNVKLDEAALASLIQTQEKLCEHFGLKRREAALGLYDFDKIKFPVIYTTLKPDQIRFVPLGMEKELSGKEILEKHEKGKRYGKLIEKAKEWPLLIDSAKKVLSMPPIINSADLGKITTETKNIFIEATGFSARFVDLVVLLMALALVDRSGELEQVQIKGPGLKKRVTPQLSPKEFKASFDELNRLLGLELKRENLVKLLEQSFEIKKVTANEATLLIPAWRQDVMDLNDIAEDVAINYGYSNFKPELPSLATEGKARKNFKEKISDLLVGLGAQEVITYILTDPKLQFKKMKLKRQFIVELANPVTENRTALRFWLLPCLLEFLSLNKSARYPQAIFEIGKVVSNEETTNLCYVITHSSVTFSSVKQVLDYLFDILDINYNLEPITHSSFIEGRVAQIKVQNQTVGIVGELHPTVLEQFNLTKPVAAFELQLDKLEKL